jgi:hypothetical protein
MKLVHFTPLRVFIIGFVLVVGVIALVVSVRYAHRLRERKLQALFASVLGAYEILYRRSGFRSTLLRLLPFVAFPLILSPLWLFYKPHPLHYKYIEFPAGAGWYSFFSVVSATGWYIKGLLLGQDIPVVLREVVARIYGIMDWRFLVWGLIDLGILIGTGWVLLRKRWVGLGVVLGVAAMFPFVSTAWNGVEDCLSWTYLYVSLVGLALLVGESADALWPSGWRCPYFLPASADNSPRTLPGFALYLDSRPNLTLSPTSMLFFLNQP